MPFTPSHAVLALPFVRTPLVPAAIAIGAMTPDLPLFLPGLPPPLTYSRTHNFVWLTVTVTLALVLLLIWRCVLRPAAREFAPRWLGARLPPEWDGSALSALRETFALNGNLWTFVRGNLLLIVSLVIGVVSHIVWDLFTHEDRWGVEVLPIIDEQWGRYTGYRWLQHGSSVVGLVILAIAAIVWLRRRRPEVGQSRILPTAVRWAWWISLPVTLAAGWMIGLVVWGPFTSDFTVRHLAYRVLPPACAVWGALTILMAIGVQIARAISSRSLPPSPPRRRPSVAEPGRA